VCQWANPQACYFFGEVYLKLTFFGGYPDYRNGLTNPCSFTDITCNGAQNITGIDWQFVDVEGTIPTDFSLNLPDMQNLNLFFTGLRGDIGLFAANWTSSLLSLSLSEGITGELTDVVTSRWTSLQIIKFSTTEIVWNITYSSLAWHNLQQLMLDDNLGISIDLTQDLVTSLNISSINALEFYGMQVSGSLPTQLGLLVNLQSFQINTIGEGDCSIEGSIPTNVGRMTALRQFILYGCTEVFGTIPTEFGNLTQLETFGISNANINGSIPSQLANWGTSLVNLDFENMPFLQGPLPTQIGNLTALTSINFVSNANFVSTLPTQLGLLTAMESFDFSGNGLLHGTIPTELGNFGANLGSFILSGSPLITGTLPSQIARWTSAYEIELSHLSITGNTTYMFSLMGTQLDFLTFSGLSEVTGEFPSVLDTWTSLEILDIEDMPQMGGTIPSNFGLLPNLGSVTLINTGIGGSIPASLGSGLNQLYSLVLQYNQFSSALPNFSNASNLFMLDVSNNFLEGELDFTCKGRDAVFNIYVQNNSFTGDLNILLQNFTGCVFNTNLSHNLFYGIVKSDAFVNNSDLITFDATYNDIAFIESPLLPPADSILRTFDLMTGNPLLCPVPDYSDFAPTTDYNPSYCNSANSVASRMSYILTLVASLLILMHFL
jgi:hypothetical protein